MIQRELDERYMSYALRVGRRGLGRTWPNPCVGCVIVKDNVVLAAAHTADGGRPHAERLALSQAGAAAKGADVYVTLEPCSHHGKTAPCAQALIDSEVSRVVVAVQDPDSRVSGRGVSLLRAAGIDVVEGVLQHEASWDHAGFFTRVTQGRPFLTLKLAMSIDGRIATSLGESQWITGTQSRRTVHMMRSRHDAVLVGAGTAVADDPMLTVRTFQGAQQPIRIVASRRARLSAKSQMANTANQVPAWLCHGQDQDVSSLTQKGVISLPCREKLEDEHMQLDLLDVMQKLGTRGLTRVFCEGGGQLAAALLKLDLVDELVVMNAGLLLGSDGLPCVGPLAWQKLSYAPRFILHDTCRLGEDVVQFWRRDSVWE